MPPLISPNPRQTRLLSARSFLFQQKAFLSTKWKCLLCGKPWSAAAATKRAPLNCLESPAASFVTASRNWRSQPQVISAVPAL